MIEISDAVKVPELAEIVEVDELTPVVEVVKESVEEVSSESRCLNCDAEMTFDHQCDDMNSDSDWEDVDSDEKDIYPTIDLDCEDWADKFSASIHRFHGSKQ